MRKRSYRSPPYVLIFCRDRNLVEKRVRIILELELILLTQGHPFAGHSHPETGTTSLKPILSYSFGGR